MKFFYIGVLTLGLLFSCQKEESLEENETEKEEKDTTSNTYTGYLNPNLEYGSVTDVEGNEYATIVIGSQEWMVENLKTSKFCNGDPIPHITDDNEWYNVSDGSQWTNDTSAAWSYFDNNSSYNEPYGKLYNWYAVGDQRNICPCGWHVPTESEWMTLFDYLGGINVAGGKLKSTSMEHWKSPNTAATNESGFSALAAGLRTEFGSFNQFGTAAAWWSSELSTLNAYRRLLPHNSANGNVNTIKKEYGLSIRCVKN